LLTLQPPPPTPSPPQPAPKNPQEDFSELASKEREIATSRVSGFTIFISTPSFATPFLTLMVPRIGMSPPPRALLLFSSSRAVIGPITNFF
jgi:hypothetical protein